MMNWRESSRSYGNGACVEVGFRKSIRSMTNGNCVEVGGYRKPQRSVGNGACVEVGTASTFVAVRDTTDRDGVTLMFPDDTWMRFTSSLK